MLVNLLVLRFYCKLLFSYFKYKKYFLFIFVLPIKFICINAILVVLEYRVNRYNNIILYYYYYRYITKTSTLHWLGTHKSFIMISFE